MKKVIKIIIKCDNIHCDNLATLSHKGLQINLCDTCAMNFNKAKNFVNKVIIK